LYSGAEGPAIAEPPEGLIETPGMRAADMDVLTNVLAAMKLSGSVFLDAEFSAPWCVASQIQPDDCAAYFSVPAHVISYHYVRSGSLLCTIEDGDPVELREGQIFLIPHNNRHLLGSEISKRPVSARDLVVPVQQSPGAQLRHGGGGEKTLLYCGFLGTLTPINAFLLSLPSLMVIDVNEVASGEWMESSIRYASGQASPDLIGRLAELLFLEAVKYHVEQLPEDQGGWLGALRDPHLNKALTLIHQRCAEAWTTEALAREAGLSRSAFADRFTARIGDPPMRYLAKHRMNVAANLLQEGSQNSSNIAYTVGFNSEAAFSRAFKKEFGVPPGAWRREHANLVTA
jgi:AraC-like DNA-binding protein